MNSNEELKELAIAYVSRLEGYAESKDVEKASYLYYEIVKRTIGLAKEQDVYDRDRGEIKEYLDLVKSLIKITLISFDWDMEMIKEFEERVNKLVYIE